MESNCKGEGLGDTKTPEFLDCHRPSRFCKGKGDCINYIEHL